MRLTLRDCLLLARTGKPQTAAYHLGASGHTPAGLAIIARYMDEPAPLSLHARSTLSPFLLWSEYRHGARSSTP